MLRYAITNGRTGDEGGDNPPRKLAERCAELVAGGVDCVILREKHLGAGALKQVARLVVEAVAGRGKVLVAQRVDVALAAGADGVHLSARPGELTVGQVRRLMPSSWVSVSCHTVEEVRRAREAGASAALFGPVFGKQVNGVEVVAGVGLQRLGEACAAAGEMPVLALGGVGASNAEECVRSGAAGIAGIKMFFGEAAMQVAPKRGICA